FKLAHRLLALFVRFGSARDIEGGDKLGLDLLAGAVGFALWAWRMAQIPTRPHALGGFRDHIRGALLQDDAVAGFGREEIASLGKKMASSHLRPSSVPAPSCALRAWLYGRRVVPATDRGLRLRQAAGLCRRNCR